MKFHCQRLVKKSPVIWGKVGVLPWVFFLARLLATYAFASRSKQYMKFHCQRHVRRLPVIWGKANGFPWVFLSPHHWLLFFHGAKVTIIINHFLKLGIRLMPVVYLCERERNRACKYML